MAKFDEESHPRDEHGRFTGGPGALSKWAKNRPRDVVGRHPWREDEQRTGAAISHFVNPEGLLLQSSAYREQAGGRAKPGKYPSTKVGRVPDKSEGPGALGKEGRKRSEESKAKAAETRALTKAVGQKDAPIDLLDLAAAKLVQQGRSWERRRTQSSEEYRASKEAVNQALGGYLTEGHQLTQGGWYGHYDPKSGREVVHVSQYDLNRNIVGKVESDDSRAQLFARSTSNRFLRVKDKDGNPVREDFSISREEPNLRKDIESKGHEAWGPKEPGWYFVDSLDKKEPEKVEDRLASGRAHTQSFKDKLDREAGTGNDEWKYQGAKTQERIKDEDGRMAENRFPLAVHPAIADKLFPGSKQTYAEKFRDAIIKAHGGYEHSLSPDEDGSEYKGQHDDPYDHRGQQAKALDTLTHKLWTKLEPQIRQDMAANGGYNRFWTPQHIQEYDSDKYHSAVQGLLQDVNRWNPQARALEPLPLHQALTEVLRDKNPEHTKSYLSERLPARTNDPEAWAGKRDPWTDDPLTLEEAKQRGIIHKYKAALDARKKPAQAS